MIQVSAPKQEIDYHHIDPIVFDHLQFLDHVTNLEFVIFIVIKISALTELHQVQGTLIFENNEKFLDLPVFVPPETILSVLFLVLILEIDCIF